MGNKAGACAPDPSSELDSSLFQGLSVDGKADLGRALWSYCRVKLTSYPNFEQRMVQDLVSVPSIQAVFFPNRAAISPYILNGTDYTTTLKDLATSVLAYCVTSNHWFDAPSIRSTASTKIQEWLGANSVFMIDRMLQHVLDEMNRSPWFKDFTPDEWRDGIASLVSVDSKGRSSWIVPATWQQGTGDLPMTFMIAIAKHFCSVEQWAMLQASVQNAFSAPVAASYLSLADHSKHLSDGHTTQDVVTAILQDQSICSQISNACSVAVDIHTGDWVSHEKMLPGAHGEAVTVWDDDTQDVTELHGQHVQDWLNGNGFTFSASSNISHRTNTRRHPDQGACFLPGTEISCISPDGMRIFHKPVERVTAGDLVVSEHGYISVASDEPVHYAPAQVKVVGFEFTNGEQVQCFATRGHPFWTHNAGWCAVDEAMANSENGFLQVSQLSVSQCLFRVRHFTIREPFCVKVEYDAMRVARILETHTWSPVYGLHFRSGVRSYHAQRMLVAMNYPEITYSRIMLGIQRLSRSDYAQACKHLKAASGLVAKGTQCISIGGAFRQGGKLPAAHSYFTTKPSICGHSVQAEYILTLTQSSLEEGAGALRIHSGHVSLHMLPETGLQSASPWHWTESHHFGEGYKATDVRFTRKGELFAKFCGLNMAMRCRTLRPDLPNLVYLQSLCSESPVTLTLATNSTPTVYSVYTGDSSNLCGQLRVDVGNVVWDPLDHLHTGMAVMEVNKENNRLELLVIFDIPLLWNASAYTYLKATFAGDLQTFGGRLCHDDPDSKADGPVVYGLVQHSRPAPLAALAVPTPLGNQPLIAGQCPSWAADLVSLTQHSVSEVPMGAELLFFMEPPNADQLYTSIMQDLMHSALALYPSDQVESLKIGGLVKDKHVPGYLQTIVKEPGVTRILQSIVSAQVSTHMWNDETRFFWEPVGADENAVKQRSHFYLQSNGETCLGGKKEFRRAFDAVKDHHYARLMPEFQAYLNGEGGKTPGQWAQELYRYATQPNCMQRLIMADPSDGAINKLTHMLSSLTAKSPNKKDKEVVKQFSDAIALSLVNHGRKFAGTFAEKDMVALFTQILEGFWNQARDMKLPQQERSLIAEAFATMGVRSGSQLTQALGKLINRLAKFWYMNKESHSTVWSNIYEFQRTLETQELQIKLTPAVKSLLAWVQHSAAWVIATFGIVYTATFWGDLRDDQKASMVTACISDTFSVVQFLVKKGMTAFGLDPLEKLNEIEKAWSTVVIEIAERTDGQWVGAAAEVARVWSSVHAEGAVEFGRGFIKNVVPKIGTILGSVAGIVSLVSLGFTLKQDIQGHDVTLAILDSIGIIAGLAQVAVNVAEIAGFGEVSIAMLGGLSVPVVGEVAAVIGLVAGVAAMIVKLVRAEQELTTQQQWVKDVGAPMLQVVDKPTQEWIAQHPIPP